MDSLNKWFLDPIKEHYFDFDGRVSREQFWMFVLWYLIFSFVVGLAARILSLPDLEMLYGLALLIPSLFITTRRLHDVDKSGLWQLLWIIPIIGWIILLVFLASKGMVGGNKYGPDPLDGASPVPPASSVVPNQASAPAEVPTVAAAVPPPPPQASAAPSPTNPAPAEGENPK